MVLLCIDLVSWGILLAALGLTRLLGDLNCTVGKADEWHPTLPRTCCGRRVG
ncbi:hypothetical protein [Gimesia chilikensis]|uniref:hypothetical protein n=1 Tax=Gimesia chilikensis TaxID=2605989 RepID=UPI003A913B03